ncbi:ABC transporter permease subunit [Terribacillus saccharophilus]|uniref:ABC transmembrane type-1 domain-containing protein n=1 Tax=Terribacillus saccharophilus TaxID=361277 RepID=A0ABX4GY27_9BACI|nr:ABC transporter permease subunit [Terribacillus saccharophilus]PAD35157.1 hypothetical protein CHH56_10430 [Terribacillus saccharophilus]PAD95906.1 hypothetical protein CHH50_10625 [Terribacillus saccharophilus]PAD99770.1 hypothetical protein CHH48_11010 [Terribacillus saccharophilus]
MRAVSFVGYLFAGLVGLVLISCIPSIFISDSSGYFSAVAALTGQILDPSRWVYDQGYGRVYPLFDYLAPAMTYSMTILIGALLTGFIGGLLFAVASCLLPNKVVFPFKRLGYLFESIPDVILAFGIQLFIVFFYKQFGLLLFRFSSAGQEEIYVLPILILAILPFVTFYRFVLSMLEEEQQKDYVLLAKSKGVGREAILFRHVLPNILPSAFLHTKVITWATLSALPAIEYLMNLYGITSILKEMLQPVQSVVFFLILAAFFVPFYFIYSIAEMIFGEKSQNSSAPAWKAAPLVGSRGKGSRIFYSGASHKQKIYRNKKFMAGFVLVALLFIGSCIYTLVADPIIQVDQYQYDDAGNMVQKAPFGPGEDYWLGTDRLGRHLDDLLIAGAKFTIGFALLVAALRIGCGFMLAIPYVLLMPARVRKFLDQLADGLHYVPQSLLAIMLLMPIIAPGSLMSFPEKIIWQIVILLLLVLPLTTILLGKEIQQSLSSSYVTSGVVLGASRLQLLRKHVWPQIKIRCYILFGQQTLQVIVLFIHLGVFQLYFGGTVAGEEGFSASPATSEWSSQISFLRYMLMTGQGFYTVSILLAYLLLIGCIQLMVDGLKEVELRRLGLNLPKKEKNPETYLAEAAAGLTASSDAFRFHDKTIELK